MASITSFVVGAMLFLSTSVAAQNDMMTTTTAASSSSSSPVMVVCAHDEPDTDCGIVSWNMLCEEVIASKIWLNGNCCSLSDKKNGGRLLTADGPESFSVFKEKDQDMYSNYY